MRNFFSAELKKCAKNPNQEDPRPSIPAFIDFDLPGLASVSNSIKRRAENFGTKAKKAKIFWCSCIISGF